MSLAVGYVLQATAEVAGGEQCPGLPDLTVSELATEVDSVARELLRTAGPDSTVLVTGDDTAATVQRLAAAVVGLALTDDPTVTDVREPAAPPASVEVRSGQVWSEVPLLRSPDGATVTHGEFLSRLESVPPPGWPEDLLLLVRDLNRLGRWAAVREHLATLPDVKQHEDPRGTRWSVHNRLVARVVDESTLLVRCDFAARERLLRDHPESFGVRPSLERHQKVLADIGAGDPAVICSAITAAWELQR